MKFWTAIQGALGTAILAVLGWTLIQIVDLKSIQSAKQAEDELRMQVTDVVNDIDKRLAVIETHLEWIRSTSGGYYGEPAMDDEAMLLPAPAPAPAPPEAPYPKYNLRDQQQQSR